MNERFYGLYGYWEDMGELLSYTQYETIKTDKYMENYIDRMIAEHKQLAVRIKALQYALDTEGYLERVGRTQFKLLHKQLAGMELYEDALACRLLDEHIDPQDEYQLID